MDTTRAAEAFRIANEALAEWCRQCRAFMESRLSPCPDCRGTGEYRGLASIEPCRTCGGRGTT